MTLKLRYKQILFSAAIFFESLFALHSQALAQTTNTEDILTLFGQACERVKPQETIASIRLRATDKATFDAIKNLDNISALSSQYSDHDLNVLIYKIVDNYVEDLAVQTTQQNEQKICIEITGYVNAANISVAAEELKNELLDNVHATNEPANDDALSEEKNSDVSIHAEPEVITQDTAASEENSVSPQTSETLSSQKLSQLVYIAPLQFFNNTSSSEYTKILKRMFDNNAYFKLTDDESSAQYIIYPKVLRAKVDAINSNTNRMQMVVSVEVKNIAEKSSAIEHQNRFILFSSTDDEQKVAAGLMQKLLTKAGKLILNKVERMAQIQAEKNGEISDAFITPKNSSLIPSPDVEKSGVLSIQN